MGAAIFVIVAVIAVLALHLMLAFGEK